MCLILRIKYKLKTKEHKGYIFIFNERTVF